MSVARGKTISGAIDDPQLSDSLSEGAAPGLWASLGLASAVLDALPDATAVIDQAGFIVATNRSWKVFAIDNQGQEDATGVGTSYLDVCDRAAKRDCLDALRTASGIREVLAGETLQIDLEYPCPSPSVDRWFMLRVTPLGGKSGGAVASHVNITRRKRLEVTLAHNASHDPLTGLANRVLFNSQLTLAISRRPGRGDVNDVGLLYIDLDHFKQVNDRYGHAAGDELLVATAARLATQIRPQDLLARLGGDEFAIVAPRVNAAVLDAMARRLDGVLAEPMLVNGRDLQIRASVGAYLAGPSDSVAVALAHADQAMYKVKAARAASSSPPT